MSKLIPYVAAVFVLSVIRFGINFTRRYATARIGVHIEARVRELLYSAYLHFPREFYDRHATGQVVSRATNDLYPIRYFIGWGMVQGAQSGMMIVGAAVMLSFVNLKLTVLTFLTLPLIGLLAWLFAHRVMPISRRVQQRKGDVTEAADEAVVGIEMVQAFGREDDVRGRFIGKAEGVRDVVLEQATVESQHLPGLFFLPSLSIAAVRLLRRPRRDRRATCRSASSSCSTRSCCSWPGRWSRWAGSPTWPSARWRRPAAASRGSRASSGCRRPRAAARTVRRHSRLSFEAVRFAYGDEDEVLRGVDLEVDAGRDRGRVRRHRIRQDARC